MLEHGALPLRGPDLELRVATRVQPDAHLPVAGQHVHVVDGLVARAVEPFGQPHKAGEDPYGAPQRPREPAVPVMRTLWRAPAVIARDERDDLDLVRVEPPETTILDQIVRVTVVPLVADVHADVVEQRGVLQPPPLAIAKLVPAPRPVEQSHRERGHVPGMLGRVPAPLPEFDDAAQAHVGVAFQLTDRFRVAPDVIEDQPLAQREVRQRQLARAEPVEQRVEQDAAGHREVRATRIETRKLEAMLQRHRGQPLADAVDRLGGDPHVAQVFWRLGPGRKGTKTEDRARRANHPVEPSRSNLPQIRACLPADVPGELPLVRAGHRIAGDEPLREPDDADLEAARHHRPRRGAERDFNAAAANIDHHRPSPPDVRAVGGRQVDEPRLFGRGNDVDADADLTLNAPEELAAVFRLAGRAGGRRKNLIDLMRIGEPAVARERIECGGHRLFRQPAATQSTGTKPDHFLLAIDDLEGQIRSNGDHDHVDGIAAEIDGRDAHVSARVGNALVRYTCTFGAATRSNIFFTQVLQGAHRNRRHPSMMSSVSPAVLVRRRTRALVRALPGAIEGDPAALHRTRVASRRLRELTALFDDVPRKVRRRVRKLTSVLGQVREMDVALKLLDDQSIRARSQPGALAARRHVEAARDVRRRTMLRRLQKLNTQKLEHTLAELANRAPNEDPAIWKRRLGQRIAARARRLAAALAEAGALYMPERLHAVRIAAKKLRYAIEIAAELGVPRAAAAAAQVRRSQVTLGNLQDRHVLLRELRATTGETSDDAVRHSLLTLGAQIEQDARELHGQFLSQRPALLALLAALRGQVVVNLIAGRPHQPLRATWSRSSPRLARAAGRRG